MPDLRSLLTLPSVYTGFQWLVGAGRARKLYVREHLRPRAGDAVLDVGCGPADILDDLPDIRYVGIDLSERYVAAARKRFGRRGTFEVKDVSDLAADRAGEFDLVMANGVLHHLPDDVVHHLLNMVGYLLKPGGRFVSFDGCYVPGQSRVARYFLSRDRGDFIRDQEGYLRLAREVFPGVRATIRHDLLRIPYTHIVLEAGKAA